MRVPDSLYAGYSTELIKNMFDTHAHLNFPMFEEGTKDIVGAAQRAGVHKICVPGTDMPSSLKAVDLAEQHDMLYAAVGIHPAEIVDDLCEGLNSNAWSKEVQDRAVLNLRELAESSESVVAIGEIGLDKLYSERHCHTLTSLAKKKQQEMFIKQFRLARTLGKSVIIHNRGSTEQLLTILHNEWDDHYYGRVVFHCCEPEYMLLDFAQDHDIFIGTDGDVTYNKDKQRFIARVPLDRLVVETDSPFMAPHPIREKKKFPNVPENLRYVVDKVAELHEKTPEEVSERTLENAMRLFRLKS